MLLGDIAFIIKSSAKVRFVPIKSFLKAAIDANKNHTKLKLPSLIQQKYHYQYDVAISIIDLYLP